jgi:hypothetical protein
MAFRKAVGAKTLDLRDGLLGKLARIPALDHAAEQFVLEMRKRPSRTWW